MDSGGVMRMRWSCRYWPAWVVWGAPGATAGTDWQEPRVLRTVSTHIFDTVCAHFRLRLPLENWSAIVLRKTWRCGGNAHVQIYIYLSVSILCLHWYYYIWNDTYLHTFQLLAALLTMYTYGYTRNSICVHMSTISIHTYQLCKCLCTLIFIFTHHISYLYIIYLSVTKKGGVLN